MTVIIDDHVVSYERKGSTGPVLVMLHGWGDSKETFSLLAKDLQQSYSIISVDLPGFGKSDAPSEAYDLKKYAQFVATFLKKIDSQHVFAFVGHSNGGAIAIKGLANGILQSEKLVLLASAGVRSVGSSRKHLLRIAAKTVKYPTILLPKNMQNAVKKKAYKTIGSDLYIAEHLQATFKKIVSEDLLLEAAMIPQKTILVYGRNDASTPVTFGQKLQSQIELSKLVVIEDADHFLHQSHEKAVLVAVRGFLEEGA